MTPKPKRKNTEREQSTTSELTYFSNDVLVAVDESLAFLLEESKARCAMVIDRTGCIVSALGDFQNIGHEVMGATAAGVVAALNVMVSNASSPEVSIKLYGADPDKIHFAIVADRLILCILYSRHTTTGQIRAAAKTFSQSVTPHVHNSTGEVHNPESVLKSIQYIESKLDDIFQGLI